MKKNRITICLLTSMFSLICVLAINGISAPTTPGAPVIAPIWRIEEGVHYYSQVVTPRMPPGTGEKPNQPVESIAEYHQRIQKEYSLIPVDASNATGVNKRVRFGYVMEMFFLSAKEKSVDEKTSELLELCRQANKARFIYELTEAEDFNSIAETEFSVADGKVIEATKIVAGKDYLEKFGSFQKAISESPQSVNDAKKALRAAFIEKAQELRTYNPEMASGTLPMRVWACRAMSANGNRALSLKHLNESDYSQDAVAKASALLNQIADSTKNSRYVNLRLKKLFSPESGDKYIYWYLAPTSGNGPFLLLKVSYVGDFAEVQNFIDENLWCKEYFWISIPKKTYAQVKEAQTKWIEKHSEEPAVKHRIANIQYYPATHITYIILDSAKPIAYQKSLDYFAESLERKTEEPTQISMVTE